MKYLNCKSNYVNYKINKEGLFLIIDSLIDNKNLVFIILAYFKVKEFIAEAETPEDYFAIFMLIIIMYPGYWIGIKILSLFSKKEKNQKKLKNRGIALTNHGMYGKALVCYNKALKLNPKDGEVWVNKGSVLGSLGKHEEAIACYDKALKLNPNDDEIWFNKACSESKLNNKIKSIEYLRRAIELNITNKESAIEDEDFNNIRNDEKFIELVNSSQKNESLNSKNDFN